MVHQGCDSCKTKRKCEIKFTLPEFHENRKINYNAYLEDESHQAAINYDIIIGRDLMHSLGINSLTPLKYHGVI